MINSEEYAKFKQDFRKLDDYITSLKNKADHFKSMAIAFSKESRKFKKALSDACISTGVMSLDENNPRQSINDLIGWHMTIALDPNVSKPAEDLITKHQVKILQHLLNYTCPVSGPVLCDPQSRAFIEDEIKRCLKN